MIAGLFTLYWDNLDPRMAECQKLAINSLGYPINQHRIDQLPHGEWMDWVVRQFQDIELFVFLDVDAVPLSRQALVEVISSAELGNIAGCAQAANHIPERRNQIYAGPFFLAFSRETWERLGRPSLSHGADRDVAQSLTIRAQECGIEVELWLPTSVEIPKWPLGKTGLDFGIGTTYGGLVYHLFESRSGEYLDRFSDVCRRVVEGVRDEGVSRRPVFTSDWLTPHLPVWDALFSVYKGKPVNVLEIGSYEGRSTVWFCENILGHPASSITCVDVFDGDGTDTYDEGKVRQIEERFRSNILPYAGKVNVCKGRSSEVLRDLRRAECFDVIYVDGSHRAWNVLEDAVLCYPLLKTGGLMLFDDYLGGDLDSMKYPHQAIDAFLRIHAGSLEVVHSGYQLAVKKIDSSTVY